LLFNKQVTATVMPGGAAVAAGIVNDYRAKEALDMLPGILRSNGIMRGEITAVVIWP
jgi:hypothetical protein